MGSVICTSGKRGFINALAGRIWKVALYTSAESLDEFTRLYTTKNEVPDGSGYEAGGLVLSAETGTDDDGSSWLSFDDAVWPNASFIARCALIYDSSDYNTAWFVIDFGVDLTRRGGDFAMVFPNPLFSL